MLDHFCVLSGLATVIFRAILHFLKQVLAILHSGERNHPGHYTQGLGTDCISTAISLIIFSLRSLCFFMLCIIWTRSIWNQYLDGFLELCWTPLTPSPSTTRIISEALGVSRKSDSWEVWGVEDNTGFSDQKVQQVKTQKVLFISDERVEHMSWEKMHAKGV